MKFSKETLTELVMMNKDNEPPETVEGVKRFYHSWLQLFVILVTFLVIAATPWMVYHNAEAMCYEAMQRAITNTY